MTANERIHEIVGLEWSATKKDGMNYNFLTLSDGQVLLDWCRENVERKCQKCQGYGQHNAMGNYIKPVPCDTCHGTGKISNLPAICEIITLLWEGEECDYCKGSEGLRISGACPACYGTSRITNRPLAWAIWGEVVLPYCQKQEWWNDFGEYLKNNIVEYSILFNPSDTFDFVNPLAFVNALMEFLKGEK